MCASITSINAKLVRAIVIGWVFTAAALLANAQSFSSIHSFCLQSNCPDGEVPSAWLVQGDDGSLYGTTVAGGTSGKGTVFKITASGSLTTLHSFNGTDGTEPTALIRASDGSFYGATTNGGGNCGRGTNGCGTVFKITPAGQLTTLHIFCTQQNCPDGNFPAAALVQASDGNLYGSTQDGGSNGQCGIFGCGTIFRITTAGAFTTVYKFCPAGNCTFLAADGAHPTAAMVQGADGALYGTTEDGGINGNNCIFGCGTVFRLSKSGVLTRLYAFTNRNDGTSPGQMMQALDGNFYGVTETTLFRMTPIGALTTIHSFAPPQGGSPVGLLQATDGNFYGVSSQGGNNNCVFGCGTLFRTNASGAVTILHQFDGTDGATPMGGLVQDTDGNLYGTTSKGGTSTRCQGGCGTVFRLSTGIRAFVQTQPSIGAAGTNVTILGSNLTGASAVSFNGTAAQFTVVSPSQISATVPAGATTGVVRVTTAAGTFASNSNFQVPGPFQFVAVTPCRLVDTRQSHHPIQSNTFQTFTLPQLGNCGIPDSAAVYSLNVTVIPHGPLSYLTVWSAGAVQPFASTMNSLDGRIKANAAVVPAGNNAISVFASNTTDVALDIDGYFTFSGPQTYQFYPLTPCRVIDTRKPDGQLGSPFLSGAQERDFPVRQSPCVPQNVDIKAYSFNVTAIPHPSGQPLSYLKVWPQGDSQPEVSTLNNPTATLVANAAIVPAGTGGGIAVFPSQDTDIAVDINGYFAAPGNGGLSLYPVPTCRVLDTRYAGHGAPFVGQLKVNVAGSICQPPGSSHAYIFNATVVPVGPLAYLTLWPDGQQRPVASTLNALDGFITSNMAIVPTQNGFIDAFASNPTQMILDISAYFGP